MKINDNQYNMHTLFTNQIGEVDHGGELTVTMLIQKMEQFFSQANHPDFIFQEKVLGLFHIADRLHYGECRRTGEAYIQHPLRATVAIIEKYIEDMPHHRIIETVMLMIFHDVLEDTGFTEQDLIEYFHSPEDEIDFKMVAKAADLISKKPVEFFIDEAEKKELQDRKNRDGMRFNAKDYTKNITILAKRLRIEEYHIRFQIMGKSSLGANELSHNDAQLLGLNEFSSDDRKDIITMVTLCKGADSIDNLSTFASTDNPSKIVYKTQESLEHIITHIPENTYIHKFLSTIIKENLEKTIPLLTVS